MRFSASTGASCIELDGKFFFFCSTVEKGSCRVTLRGRGEPGHASQPNQNNAILPLARALVKLIEQPLPLRVTRTARAQIQALAQGVDAQLAGLLMQLLDPETHSQALHDLPLAAPVKRRLAAALRNTATPTILRAGSKINVIPAEAKCEVDCRVLPGATADSLRAEIVSVIGDQVGLDLGPFIPALERDPDSPLFDTIRQVIVQRAPGGTLIPGLITGGTDAKRVSPLGIKVYGFVPMRYEGPAMTGLAHNHNERVSLGNLEFGTHVLCDVVKRFCGE